MYARRSWLAVVLLVVVALSAVSCRSVLRPEYEYDEDVQLALDGSAVINVSASVPALVALRGADLDPDPRARLDRLKVRDFFASPVLEVANVSTSRRDNRRYVHVRLEVPDIRRLHEAPAFAWSRYAMSEQDDRIVYRQDMQASADRDVGGVGWRGDELMAVRLHLPSRVPWHNAPSRTIERGNIIVWEQPLSERLAGQPLAIEVHLETTSILGHTLGLFGITIVLAALTFVVAIWWTMRMGGRQDSSAER